MKIILALLLVVVLLSSFTHGQIDVTETYTHHSTFTSGNVTIKLHWKFTQTDITFEVHGQTQGWIGIGFSPNGAMTKSDIFVGWVKDGKVKVTDRHGADSNGFPPIDTEQNIDVIMGKECDGWTMFKFKRELAGCESGFDKDITADTQRVIWAYNDNDPTGKDMTSADKHGNTNKGVSSMYMLDAHGTDSEQLPVGQEYKTFDVRADNFNIPATGTYYNCKVFKVPELDAKHHIVKIEPVIQKGNEQVVHHILVHQCADVLKNPSDLGVDSRCYGSGLEHSKTCTRLIAAWAIGGQEYIYPKDVGFSIGSSGDPIYIQTETHYDNPSQRSDIFDSSGIRFTYTSTIRQHDAGVLQVGSKVSPFDHLIPPNAESFRSYGFCDPACLNERMTASNVTSVTVISAGLHSHLAGRAIKLRHIRNGKELKYIANDAAYDFDYQSDRVVNPPVELRSTDQLQLECVYKTKGRSLMTEGGLSTQEEMCLAFLVYYPRIDLAICTSNALGYQSWAWFGIRGVDTINGAPWGLRRFNVTESTNQSQVGMTAMDVMSQQDWTEERVDRFSTDLLQMTQTSRCVPQDKEKETFANFMRPTIREAYTEPELTCTRSASDFVQEKETDKCKGFHVQPLKIFTILVSAISLSLLY